jgi:hypothetical protein
MDKKQKQFPSYEDFEVQKEAFKGTIEGSFIYEFIFNKKLDSVGYFKAIEKALKNQDYAYYLYERNKWNMEHRPTRKQRVIRWWNRLIAKLLIK